MTTSALTDAHRLLDEAIGAFEAAVGPTSSDDELLSVPALCSGLVRRLDRLSVSTISTLQRRGIFSGRGYRNPISALTDLLGCDRPEARRQVVAAEQVCPRIGLDGSESPARLPATAARFTDGRLGIGHVDVIAKLLDKPEARRLSPEVWAGAEAGAYADKATCYTPGELYAYGMALITALDQDGAEPDEAAPPPVNELHLRPHRDGGGSIVGRFGTIPGSSTTRSRRSSTPMRPRSPPTTSVPLRSATRRRSPTSVATSSITAAFHRHPRTRRPPTTPQRPHQARGPRGARPGGHAGLRRRAHPGVATDAGLRRGRGAHRHERCRAAARRRSIRSHRPKGLRRAVYARDGGCAHPGCDRPPSWCEIHHLIPWELGGETTLGNSVMLCRVHHRLLHADSGWIVRIADGLPEFVPPAWIDPTRRPRRRPRPHLVREPSPATPAGTDQRARGASGVVLLARAGAPG